MVNLVLAGALGGLGKGMSMIGEDILKQREKALEWAQEQAMYQRKLADEEKSKADDRQFDVEKIIYTNNREDARAAASQAAIANRQQSTQDFQHGETVYRENRQDARTVMTQNREDARSNKTKDDKPTSAGISSQEQAQAGANLRDLQSKMAQINTPASQRLQNIINQSTDLIGLRYGSVGQNGRAPVFGVTKLGKLRYMGFDIDQRLLPSTDSGDEGL